MTISLRSLLPDRPVPMRIWRGPFRGARIVMNPRSSLRKALGLYEHENNRWLEAALRRVNRVLDVGANDGYFTFGCVAAFRRLKKQGQIIAFEPQARHAAQLRESVTVQRTPDVAVQVVEAFVGRRVSSDTTTLDAVPQNDRRNTLIKIDVEGAEIDVIAGAQSWMHPTNLFIIEVHKHEFLAELQKMFAAHRMNLSQMNQQPLPLLGREMRDESNWWLLSDLGTTA